MEIICKDRVFTLKNGSDVLLHTDANTPMVYVGYGRDACGDVPRQLQA